MRQLRVERGLSQTDLAKLLKVQPNHISRYERGDSKPTAKSLKSIADCLEVSTDYLFNGVEEDAAVADFQDKELLGLFKEIETLSPENKEHVKALISAFVKAEKFKQLAS